MCFCDPFTGWPKKPLSLSKAQIHRELSIWYKPQLKQLCYLAFVTHQIQQCLKYQMRQIRMLTRANGKSPHKPHGVAPRVLDQGHVLFSKPFFLLWETPCCWTLAGTSVRSRDTSWPWWVCYLICLTVNWVCHVAYHCQVEVFLQALEHRHALKVSAARASGSYT